MKLTERLRTWEPIPDDDAEAFRWLGEITNEAASRIEQLEHALFVCRQGFGDISNHKHKDYIVDWSAQFIDDIDDVLA